MATAYPTGVTRADLAADKAVRQERVRALRDLIEVCREAPVCFHLTETTATSTDWTKVGSWFMYDADMLAGYTLNVDFEAKVDSGDTAEFRVSHAGANGTEIEVTGTSYAVLGPSVLSLEGLAENATLIVTLEARITGGAPGKVYLRNLAGLLAWVED